MEPTNNNFFLDIIDTLDRVTDALHGWQMLHNTATTDKERALVQRARELVEEYHPGYDWQCEDCGHGWAKPYNEGHVKCPECGAINIGPVEY